jgi:SAM-dependent methyltransferase
MKLNLCCGANCFPGWINIDKTDVEQDYLRHLREAPDGFVWPEPQRELAAWVKAGKELDFMRHDVRRMVPCANDSVDAIYIGQAIEHFNRRTEAPALLRECLRVLKPGGAIRLTTPDLDKLVSDYTDPDEATIRMQFYAREQPEFYATSLPEDQLSYLLFGASGPDSTNENYEGHHHCYTPRSLGALLTECGFEVLGQHEVLPRAALGPFHDTRDFGMSHSFAIEAVKP